MKVSKTLKPDVESFASPFFFFANNPDQQVLYVSPSVTQILGYSPSDIVGRKYTDFLDIDNQLNRDIEEMHQRRYRGDNHHYSLRSVSNIQGDERILKVQTFGKMDEHGNVIASHGIAEDVTEDFHNRTQANERLKQLMLIESSLSDRELTVLELVVEGTPNKSISRKLSITERAVEMIRARLVKKSGVDSTAQLVSQAAELRTLKSLIYDSGSAES